MPQLAIETFFTQYFWLLIIFFLFNHFILNYYVPAIAKIIKARKFTSPVDVTSSKDKKNKWNLSIELPTLNVQSSLKVNNFNDARVNWINKNSQ